MNIKKTHWSLILLFALFGNTLVAQQDPLYTQYVFNPLEVNPGYAGSREALSAVLTHRSQWIAIDGAPVTQNFALHAPSKNGKMGFGLQIVNDAIGPKNTLAASLVYAYRLRIGKGKLAFGLRGGMYNYRFNWDALEYQNQNDNVILAGASSKTTPNFDFGIYYNTKTFYTGLQIAHLNRPDLSFSDSSNTFLRTHTTFTIARAFELNDNIVFRPSILTRATSGTDATLDLNLSLLFNNIIWTGISFRSNYGIAAIIEMNITEKLRAGLSYDYALNGLRGQTGGSLEFFIGYDFSIYNQKMVSPRYF